MTPDLRARGCGFARLMKPSGSSAYVLLAASLLSWAHAELNFVVIGDWGGQSIAPYTTDAEREVAGQMGKTAAAIGSQFTVALGDNFYDRGVTNVSDPRFQETFEVRSIELATNLPARPPRYYCRMCSRAKLFSRGGMFCVAITTTMAMPQLKLHIPSYPIAGTCLTCTTLR